MIASLFAFDTVGAWVAVMVLLIHLVALRSDVFRRRLGLIAVHALACIGMALAHRLGVFLAFALIATVPLVRFFESSEARRGARTDLIVALACVIAAAGAGALVRVDASLHELANYVLMPGLLLGLASRLGLWPFGRWLDSSTSHGHETRLALVLSGGAAWLAFVRHIPNELLLSMPLAEVIAGAFALSAVVMAVTAGRSNLPIADFARAHVAVAVSAGIFFTGSRLVFDYGFAVLVGAAAISLVLASNADPARLTYALAPRDRWLLAILVLLCVGCPVTAIFVDEDLTLEGIAFAHTLIALAAGLVYVAAAVALMRFFFERTTSIDVPPHRWTGAWLIPAMLSLALILWGVAPLSLDPETSDTVAHRLE